MSNSLSTARSALPRHRPTRAIWGEGEGGGEGEEEGGGEGGRRGEGKSGGEGRGASDLIVPQATRLDVRQPGRLVEWAVVGVQRFRRGEVLWPLARRTRMRLCRAAHAAREGRA